MSDHSTAICPQISATLKAAGGAGVTMKQNLGKGVKGKGDVSQILTRSRRDVGYYMQEKSCRYLLSFEHMNERHRQTIRRIDHGTVTSIRYQYGD